MTFGGSSVNLRTQLCSLACVLALASAAVAVAASYAEQRAAVPATRPAAVNAQRLAKADAEPGQWMSVGRTYDEQRYSPLEQINTETVGKLGLAWYADFDSNRGQE